MKFFTCVDNIGTQSLFDFLRQSENIKMSCCEKVGTYEFAMFALDECVVNDIGTDISAHLEMNGGKLPAVGSDGNIYSISADGVEFKQKYKGGLLAYKIRVFLSWLKIHNDARVYKKEKKLSKKSLPGIISQQKSLFFPTFTRCLFKDSKNILRHFRFYEPKGNGKFPLVIYLHGAGLQIGSDNWMHMFEYGYINSGLNKSNRKKSCYIAVSQLPLYDNYDNFSHAQYLTELIDFVASKGKLDRSRIYIIGTSRGAHGVFKQLVMLPDTFAAAIACAGFMNFTIDAKPEPDNTEDYKKIALTPLWLEHSSDDDNVLVDESDIVYENIKSLGADVRYTRDSKGKHFAHRKFYKSGVWVDWLFENRR